MSRYPGQRVERVLPKAGGCPGSNSSSYPDGSAVQVQLPRQAAICTTRNFRVSGCLWQVAVQGE